MAKEENLAQNSMASFIQNDLAESIRNIISNSNSNSNYIVKGSAGIGQWANIPWVSIFDREVTTSAKKGYFLTYLFKKDMVGFYLTFMWGTYSFDNFNNKSFVLEESSKKFRNLVESSFNTSNLKISVDLSSNNNLANQYEKGIIYSKYYDLNDSFDDEKLEQDLKYFLEIYKFTKENYFNIKFLSVEEWNSILKDSGVIDSKMLDILKIIYEFDGHAATTSEIINVRNNLGFRDEKSYNSLIVANAKKIKNYLGKEPLINSFGDETYWNWFFYGKNIKEGFQFTLREELIQALENLYSDLEIKYFHSFFINTKKDESSFYDYLINNGYLFDKETIENYLLSLKVKPFIILTGNSGTGKTKLSQLFAKYISNIENNGEKHIDCTVKVGKSSNNSGWSLPSKEVNKIISIKGYEKTYSIIVDGIHSKGKLNLNSRLFFRDDKLKEHLSKLAKENPDQRINIRINIEDEISDSKNSKYKIVPVGANWTENRNIVGYYNVITEEYQSTPAFELIKSAQFDKNNSYFLILDEMNLSHVERYFADFLSSIESGENIPLYGSNEELEIPKNLFIVGTVNVDETTYMFSPKVLDRANTIEFKSYSAKNYMSGKFNIHCPEGDLNYLCDPLVDSNISNMQINDLKNNFEGVKFNGEDFWNILSNELDLFQNILKESSFDFGFRVINEIVRFMVVAWKYEGKPNNWDNWERYFDAQIKQKMLPKLHGSEKIIGKTLNELLNACLLNENDFSNISISKDNFKYFSSAIKLQEMIKVLKEQRYVSFIN